MMKLVIYLCVIISSYHCFSKILINSKSYYKLQYKTFVSMQLEDIKYPTKIKSVISKLTANTQKSLQNRKSRIEIELPPGVEFGVETITKANKVESNIDRNKRSNREAARLFTEMFSILSSTTVVLFPTEAEASNARNLWGSKFKGQVLSIDVPTPKGYGKLRSRRFSAEEQEQALMATDGIYVPEGTEVLIIAGPRLKDIRKIYKIHEKLGEDTLIILLNARLASMQSKSFEDNNTNDDNDATSNTIKDISNIFENVFNYAPPVIKTTSTLSVVDSTRDLLLYHEFNGKWYLAEKASTTSSSTNSSSKNKNLLSSMTVMISEGLGGNKDDLVTLWAGDNKPSETDLLKIITQSSIQ